MVRASGPATMQGLKTRPPAPALEQHLAEHGLDVGLLLRVRMLARATRRKLLGQPVEVVMVESVSGDARRVTDPLGAGLGRLLEHPSRGSHVQFPCGLARAQNREREMDDDVRALDQFAYAPGVDHVALAILGLAPAAVGGIEPAPRHADDPL